MNILRLWALTYFVLISAVQLSPVLSISSIVIVHPGLLRPGKGNMEQDREEDRQEEREEDREEDKQEDREEGTVVAVLCNNGRMLAQFTAAAAQEAVQLSTQ